MNKEHLKEKYISLIKEITKKIHNPSRRASAVGFLENGTQKTKNTYAIKCPFREYNGIIATITENRLYNPASTINTDYNYNAITKIVISAASHEEINAYELKIDKVKGYDIEGVRTYRDVFIGVTERYINPLEEEHILLLEEINRIL